MNLTVFIVLGIWYEAGVYEGDLSELEPEFVGVRYDAAAVIGLGFMGALDKCGFQGKVGTTMRRHMRISCQVPLYHLSSPILTELHQPLALIPKEDSCSLDIPKKNAVY